MEFRTRPSFQAIANKPNKHINYVVMKGDNKNFGFKKVQKKIMNESLAELMKLNDCEKIGLVKEQGKTIDNKTNWVLTEKAKKYSSVQL